MFFQVCDTNNTILQVLSAYVTSIILCVNLTRISAMQGTLHPRLFLSIALHTNVKKQRNQCAHTAAITYILNVLN